MPRKARLCPPGTFHHVMARGIEGRDIFSDTDDCGKFLDYLSTGILRTGFKCYAWVLMSNHYHLLLRVNEKHLSELMRRLNAGYAQYYSKKYKRRGYLFQDRYKSQVTQDQGYVENLIGYIHANPIRAGICKTIRELNKYPWSGHAVLTGNAKADFQETHPVLKRFGSTLESGRKGYEAFIVKTVSMIGNEDALLISADGSRSPNSYVIGDPEFVKHAFAADKAAHARIARYRLEGLSIEDIAEKVTKIAGTSTKELLQRSRGNWRSNFRKLFAYICYREYGVSIVDIAEFLGIAHSAASLAVRQGENLSGDQLFAKVLIALRP